MIVHNGNIVVNNGRWIIPQPPPPVDPYNPLGLPPNTVRVRTSDGNAPDKSGYATYETATLVPGTSDVYDVYRGVSSFKSLLQGSSNLVEVLGANTTGITDMRLMFYNCTNVQSGALALYQQASTQTNPPSKHNGTFSNCGSNTTTGAAELAQIPSDWK